MKHYILVCVFSFSYLYGWFWQKPVQHDYNAPLPEEIKKVLDEHSKDLLNVKMNYVNKGPVKHFEWLPAWMIKIDTPRYYRIEGAKQFSQAIQEVQADMCVVPKKYRYQSPDGNHFTISEFMKESDREITLEELKQLIRVAKKLRWVDPHSGNFRKLENGKIALPDTKLDYINAPIGEEWLVRTEYHLKFLITHEIRKFKSPLTQEAREYLNKKCKEYDTKYVYGYVPEYQAAFKREKLFKTRLKNFSKNFQKQYAIAELFT